MPLTTNLNQQQLQAIAHYAQTLEQMTDLAALRRQALNNYRQNLVMHNSYLNIIRHGDSLDLPNFEEHF